MEKHSDLMISTVRGYVEALGRKLTLQVEITGHAPVALKGLGDTEEPGVSAEEVQRAAL